MDEHFSEADLDELTDPDTPFAERIVALSVNPAFATNGDVAQLAAELMAARAAIVDLRSRRDGQS